MDVYVVGGAVRDLLQAKPALDLDLALSCHPFSLGRQLAAACALSFVPLDEEHGVARLASKELVFDLAQFKGGATTIEEDLARRDFTINSMALPLNSCLQGSFAKELVDPCHGLADLEEGLLRPVTDQALQDDPLRILRGFRLQAQSGFRLAARFYELLPVASNRLNQVAWERISAELQLIMVCQGAAPIFSAMADHGLFDRLFPELAAGHGVAQPDSHHLDVLAHNLEALRCLERVMAEPADYFAACDQHRFSSYLASLPSLRALKWAALFHDVGKVTTRQQRQGRITFYQHDQHGGQIFARLAQRLRLPAAESQLTQLFIAQHMRPFHLCNVRRKGPLSHRACLRLARSIGDHLPGLFLLAMADSLAGQGAAKPANMEQELAELFSQVAEVMETAINPVLAAPPLLTGHDLIKAGLQPGPLFRHIFDELQQQQVEGLVTNRHQALHWLSDNYRPSS